MQQKIVESRVTLFAQVLQVPPSTAHHFFTAFVVLVFSMVCCGMLIFVELSASVFISAIPWYIVLRLSHACGIGRVFTQGGERQETRIPRLKEVFSFACSTYCYQALAWSMFGIVNTTAYKSLCFSVPLVLALREGFRRPAVEVYLDDSHQRVTNPSEEVELPLGLRDNAQLISEYWQWLQQLESELERARNGTVSTRVPRPPIWIKNYFVN